MPESIAAFFTPQLIVSICVLAIVANVVLLSVAYSIYLERKISAYIQDRIGPNRAGFDFGQEWLKFLSHDGFTKGLWGLGQPMADGLKFLLKEDYRPARTDKVLFTLGPVMSLVPALIGFVIIPWGGLWDIGGELVHVAGANVNVGVIYLLAVASVGVYGVTIGGWASNNKYSFLGGLRATAQMISYEIPMGMALLATLLIMGTFVPQGIIEHQAHHGWGIVTMPVACVLFFICALAESNRAPFDNAEAEQELVGGYHTEYSSMRFAMFFLAEYAHMITGMSFFTLLFLGGYHLPFVPWLEPDVYGTGFWPGFAIVFLKFFVFFTKVMGLICFQMVIRWTLPRLRYDQVMMLNWQSLIPLGLTLVVATSFMVHFGQTSLPATLLMNLVLAAGVVGVQNLLPHSTTNRRIPLYGSRFSPVPGTAVSHAPTDPMALEDRPVQGTVPTS